MSELKKLKQRLRPGSVYRRYELARWSMRWTAILSNSSKKVH